MTIPQRGPAGRTRELKGGAYCPSHMRPLSRPTLLVALVAGVGCQNDRTDGAPISSPIPAAVAPATSVGESGVAEPHLPVHTRSMNDEQLRRAFARAPGALGSLSLGRPNDGALVNPEQLKSGPNWIVAYPDNAWATSETLRYLKDTFASLPATPVAYVGDLSLRWGGPLSPHKSHQSGRDVDIGYYRLDERWWADATLEALDHERTWALIRALITKTDVEVVFVDKRVQRWLHAHALAIGEDEDWVSGLFDLGRRGVTALIRHEPEHLNHMHVRFYNLEAQRVGRAVHDLAIRGLARGPIVRVPPRSLPLKALVSSAEQ